MVSKKFNYLNRRYGDLGCHTDEREREREREREQFRVYNFLYSSRQFNLCYARKGSTKIFIIYKILTK